MFQPCIYLYPDAAAAKSLQSCPTLCNPIDGSPPVGCHFLLQCMKVESESEVAQSCLTLSDRGTFGGRRKAVRDRLALQGGTGDFP